MSSLTTRSRKAQKVIGTTLASVALSFGTVAAAAASGAATPVAAKAQPAPQCTGCSAGRKGAVAVVSAARALSTPLTVRGVRPMTTPVLTDNWAGYVATGQKFKGVDAWFTVPTAHCAAGENSASVTFVGLGIGAGSTVQIGTSSYCNWGVTSYSVWTNPPLVVPAADKVKPGDQVLASIGSSNVGTQYSLMLEDLGSNPCCAPGGFLFEPQVTGPAATFASAEWVTARPTTYSSLTNFGTVNFNSASAQVGNSSGSASSLQATPVWFDNGITGAAPTSLSSGGTFSDDFLPG